MKRMRIRTWLAAMLMLLCSCAVYAYDFYSEGVFYVITSETEKTVAITNGKWGGFTYEGPVVIPETVYYDNVTYTVTSVLDNAFAGCNITSVKFPQSLNYIGKYAFKGCNALTTFAIPDGITSIKEGTFERCENLVSLKIPNSVTTIGKSAFALCKSLSTIEFPNSVTSIGDYVFYECEKLTSVKFSDAMTHTGNYTFCGCKGLASFEIPEHITSIGAGVFNSCHSLSSVRLSNGLKSIGDNAFYDCLALTSIEIPNSVTSIGQMAFSRCMELNEIIVAKDNPVYDSREGCNAVIETKTNTLVAGCGNSFIPNSVTAIGRTAFHGCGTLSEIEIPNSVTAIGDNAFDGCYELSSIEIPGSVKKLGKRAFYSCVGLASVSIEDGIIVLEDDVFWNCGRLSSISLPSSVRRIGKGAFYYCKGLTSINIPDGVTEIGKQAFAYCRELASLELPHSMDSIKYRAFLYCSKLGTIVCHATEPPVCGVQVFEQVDCLNCKLIIPDGSLDAYMNAYEWKRFYTSDGIEGLTEESVVNVYNLQGIMLRKQVRMKDLYGNLPKGTYIVNGRKIVF